MLLGESALLGSYHLAAFQYVGNDIYSTLKLSPFSSYIYFSPNLRGRGIMSAGRPPSFVYSPENEIELCAYYNWEP